MAQKLLIVEDDMFLISIYKTKFSKSNLDIAVARDGDEALELLHSFKPDVILLDLVMPRKDGYQFLAEMRELSDFKKTPVIVASNLGQRTDRDRVEEYGVKDYLIKSDNSLEQIVAKVEAALKQK